MTKKILWQIGFGGYFVFLGAAACLMFLMWENAPDIVNQNKIWLGPLWAGFYLGACGLGMAEFALKSRIELGFLINSALCALCVYLMTEGHNMAGSVAVIALLLLNGVFLFYQLQKIWGKIAYPMIAYICFLGVLLFFAYQMALLG